MKEILRKFDKYQQKHRFLAIGVAVVKKYSDDEVGRHAALLTYYLFTSLFPLLLVLTTLVDRLPGHDVHTQNTIISGVTSYFPSLGTQLSDHVHTLHRNGVALILGMLFILYGARGVADAFGTGVRKIWGLSDEKMPGFPVSTIKSVSLVVFGGVGFIAASVFAGIAASAGHGLVFRGLSVLVNAFILFWLFSFLINDVLPRHVTLKEIRAGAATATIGLVILQLLGSYVIRHEFKSLDALYSYFAVALSLLFWLYLQVQVIFYAIEIAVVNSQKLWPKSLA